MNDTDDMLGRIEAAIAAARKQEPRRPGVRRYPRPSQEISDALTRCRQSLAYYEPSIQDITLTVLYEYAAQRLLRDSVPDPACIGADCKRYRQDYRRWWEEWRSDER
jgi:hypothetical protein